LITPEQKYLIENYAVSYSPSLSIFNDLLSATSSIKENKILAFANSTLSKPLPEAEREANEIGRLYKRRYLHSPNGD
jgi:CHAT domain-containing protein